MKGYVYQDAKNKWWARFTYTDQSKQRRYVKRRAKINTEIGARATLLEIIQGCDLNKLWLSIPSAALQLLRKRILLTI